MSELTSIIVCTYNRAELLGDTLRFLLALNPIAGQAFEVVLVDNNSTDDTQRVAEEVRQEHPRRDLLRVIFEERQGLSNARNRGIAVARGELLIFVDDDILVRDPWLQVYQAARERLPGVAGFAGRVVPHFQAERPSWLTNELLGVLAVVDHGGFERDFDNEHLPMGANMGFPRATFEEHGEFRSDLGRRGRELYSNEDDEFIRRILSADERVIYLPGAIVEHIVPAERLTPEYFRRWKYQTGRTTSRAHYHDRSMPRLIGVPRYMFLQLLQSSARCGLRGIVGDRDGAFLDELRVRSLIGFIRERLFGPRPPES